MQQHTHSIAIDDAKFKKASKKLLSKLNEQYSLDLKLSSVQEILAESLGYRNLFALQNVFKDGEPVKSTDKVYLFKDLSSGQSTQIFTNLMDYQDSLSMWKGRAAILISTVMLVLNHMENSGEIKIDSNIISQYLNLDEVIRIYKTRKDLPEHIQRALNGYLASLPTFQENAPKQNDTVREQHGYLQMQFSPILDKLRNIEQDNFIIANKIWFEEKPSFNRLVLKKKLKELDCIDISWIDMEYYQDWIPKAFKKLDVIRVSDLLSYTSMIISPEKRRHMCFLLNSILNNFDTASQISKEIESVI